MLGPYFERCPFLVGEAVPLVDADNAAERARDVVQYLLDHGQVGAEARHARRDRPPNIVEGPMRDSNIVLIRAGRGRFLAGQAEHFSVNPVLGLGVSTRRRATVRREQERVLALDAGHRRDLRQRLIG